MIAGANQEIVTKFGSAGAEFLKGLRGVDHETGIKFDRSLLQIKDYKINPDHIEKNIKQQAGFAAEVAYVNKQNAEAIINKSGSIFSRSEDIIEYGKNHNVVDIVEITKAGEIVTSQMKFVTDHESLLKKIAEGSGGGKNDLSRYMDVDYLDLPTEQVDNAKKFCQERARDFRNNAEKLRKQGKIELAKDFEVKAEKYDSLEDKVRDSGISTEEAINYRMNPVKQTVKNIAQASHRAGIEGAKCGMAIGGSISLITNIIAVRAGNKELGDAILDTTKETLISAGVGYGTGFFGSAIKSVLQQSPNVVMRNLSKTGLPAMIVSTCVATGKSIKRYSEGEIDESQLLIEMGEMVNSSLSTATFSMLGQIAIPIPVLGGLIGGMIGYTLTNTFYHNFLDTLEEAKLSEIRYQFIAMRCEAARIAAIEYQNYLDDLFDRKFAQLDVKSKNLFNSLKDNNISIDIFCKNIDQFAELLGRELSFKTLDEFNDFMSSNEKLKI